MDNDEWGFEDDAPAASQPIDYDQEGTNWGFSSDSADSFRIPVRSKNSSSFVSDKPIRIRNLFREPHSRKAKIPFRIGRLRYLHGHWQPRIYVMRRPYRIGSLRRSPSSRGDYTYSSPPSYYSRSPRSSSEDDFGFAALDSVVPELRNTELGQAIESYNIKSLKELSDAGANLQVRDYDGNNLLHYLAKSRLPDGGFDDLPWEWEPIFARTKEIVKLLMGHSSESMLDCTGIENLCNDNGIIPIEASVNENYSNSHVFLALLEAGVRPKFEGSTKNWSPLLNDWLCRDQDKSSFPERHEEITRRLLEKVGDLGSFDIHRLFGGSSTHDQNARTLSLLISSKKHKGTLDIDQKDDSNTTALMRAACRDVRDFKTLLAAGADLFNMTSKGESLIDSVLGPPIHGTDTQMSKHFKNIIRTILNLRTKSATRKLIDMTSTSTLASMAFYGRLETVKCMFRAGMLKRINDVITCDPMNPTYKTGEVSVPNLNTRRETAAIEAETRRTVSSGSQNENTKSVDLEKPGLIILHIDGDLSDYGTERFTGSLMDFAFFGAQVSRANYVKRWSDAFTNLERYTFLRLNVGYYPPNVEKSCTLTERDSLRRINTTHLIKRVMRPAMLIKREAYWKYSRLLHLLQEFGSIRQRPESPLHEPSFFDAVKLPDYRITANQQPNYQYWRFLYTYEILDDDWEDEAMNELLKKHSNFRYNPANSVRSRSTDTPAEILGSDDAEDEVWENVVSDEGVYVDNLPLDVPTLWQLARFPQLRQFVPHMIVDDEWCYVKIIPEDWDSIKEQRAVWDSESAKRRRKLVMVKLEDGRITHMKDLSEQVLNHQVRPALWNYGRFRSRPQDLIFSRHGINLTGMIRLADTIFRNNNTEHSLRPFTL